jgi:hypothetical protein
MNLMKSANTILLVAPENRASTSLVTMLGTLINVEDVQHVSSLPDSLALIRTSGVHILLLDEVMFGQGDASQQALRDYITTCQDLHPGLIIFLMIVSLNHRQLAQELGVQPILKALLDQELSGLPESLRLANLL